MRERTHTGNAGNQITSEPTKVWGLSVRQLEGLVRERGVLYRGSHPNIGKRLLR